MYKINTERLTVERKEIFWKFSKKIFFFKGRQTDWLTDWLSDSVTKLLSSYRVARATNKVWQSCSCVLPPQSTQTPLNIWSSINKSLRSRACLSSDLDQEIRFFIQHLQHLCFSMSNICGNNIRDTWCYVLWCYLVQ